MSRTRAFIELAARLRPQLRRGQLERPKTGEIAKVERRAERKSDPFLEFLPLAHAQPEVYGGMVMNQFDPMRSHASDPTPKAHTNVPGAPKPDGSEQS